MIIEKANDLPLITLIGDSGFPITRLPDLCTFLSVLSVFIRGKFFFISAISENQ